MNNETNIVQSKPKTSGKKRAKKAVAFLLVVAILITSAYAFLTAHQTKTNVFTVGNIRLELHEDGWEANSALVNKQYDGTTYENGTQYISSSKLENIIPGEPITKDPMIKNVGKNPAYVYISVAMPQVNNEDMFDVNGLSGNWELFNTVEENGYKINYYYYNGQLAAGSDTDNLFQSVTLKESVYPYLSENADYSIIINGYGAQTTNTDNWKTAWNRIREADTSLPEIEIITLSYYRDNGELYFEEEKASGDPIEMKFDDSLVKQNFSFDWVEDDGTVAYEGMTMPQHSLRLNANYTPINLDNVSTSNYLNFWVIAMDGEICLRTKSVMAIHELDNKTLSIPPYVTFTTNQDGTSISSDGDIVEYPNDPFSNEPTISDNQGSMIDYACLPVGKTYTLPVRVVGNEAFHAYDDEGTISGIKKLIVPDTVRLLENYSNSLPEKTMEEIVLPYGLTHIGHNIFIDSPLKTFKIPNTVTTINSPFFGNTVCHLDTLTIPSSVTYLDESSFITQYTDNLPQSLATNIIFNANYNKSSIYNDGICIPEGTKTLTINGSATNTDDLFDANNYYKPKYNNNRLKNRDRSDFYIDSSSLETITVNGYVKNLFCDVASSSLVINGSGKIENLMWWKDTSQPPKEVSCEVGTLLYSGNTSLKNHIEHLVALNGLSSLYLYENQADEIYDGSSGGGKVFYGGSFDDFISKLIFVDYYKSELSTKEHYYYNGTYEEYQNNPVPPYTSTRFYIKEYYNG